MKHSLKQMQRMKLLTAILLGSGVTAANAANVVTQWNDAALEAIRATQPTPTVVARALAVTNTCMFDAWAAYDDYALGTQRHADLRRPIGERTAANKAQAISYAAFLCLNDLFPSEQAKFTVLMQRLGYESSGVFNDSSAAGVGQAAAQAVLTFRHADGSNQLGDLHTGAYSDYTNYQPVNSPSSMLDLKSLATTGGSGCAATVYNTVLG